MMPKITWRARESEIAVCSIQMHDNLKTISSCEDPTGPKNCNKDKKYDCT